jgi:phage shock protein C
MKRLFRSTSDKKIGGLCGGIAESYDLDPSLVRLVFVFLLVFTGFIPMLVLYVFGMIIVPEKPDEGSNKNSVQK